MFLRGKILLLSLQKLVGKQLLLDILKAQPGDRIRKPFAGISLLTE